MAYSINLRRFSLLNIMKPFIQDVLRRSSFDFSLSCVSGVATLSNENDMEKMKKDEMEWGGERERKRWILKKKKEGSADQQIILPYKWFQQKVKNGQTVRNDLVRNFGPARPYPWFRQERPKKWPRQKQSRRTCWVVAGVLEMTKAETVKTYLLGCDRGLRNNLGRNSWGIPVGLWLGS